MDHLWSPWRSAYIKEKKEKTGNGGCIFCLAASSTDDSQTLVVQRAKFNFILLNRYPYTSGHVMIAPYRHAARLQQIDEQAASEMLLLARLAESVLQRVYEPHGLNVGMNLGEAAGAGIEQHIHLHVLPRWLGDANFMTTVGSTRIIPENLAETFSKLKYAFSNA